MTTKKKRERKTKRTRRGRGEGSVFERGDGIWTGSVNLGIDAEGRRKRRTVYGSCKQEVLDALDEIRAQARTGTLPDASSLTMAQVFTRWLASNEDRLAPTTHQDRGLSVATHLAPRIGTLKLAKLNALHIEGMLAEMRKDKVGPFAIHYAYACLTAALNYAVRLRLIPHSPADAVQGPTRPRREMLTLTGEQAKQLLDTAKGLPCFPLLSLALGSGCRQGELLALTWGDLDLDKGTLTVKRALTWTKGTGFQVKEPKTAAGRRTITLPSFAVEALQEHRRQQLKAGLISSPVFCTTKGGYQFRRNVLRSLQKVIDRVNDPDRNRVGGRPKQGAKPVVTVKRNIIPEGFRFHDLRHTVASLLLSAGRSLKAVSQRLGHANAALTLRVYAHCLPGDDETLSDTLGKVIC